MILAAAGRGNAGSAGLLRRRALSREGLREKSFAIIMSMAIKKYRYHVSHRAVTPRDEGSLIPV